MHTHTGQNNHLFFGVIYIYIVFIPLSVKSSSFLSSSLDLSPGVVVLSPFTLSQQLLGMSSVHVSSAS